MAIVFKAPKSTLNTTSKQIQNVNGNCPPCPEPVLEGKELNYTQNGEYTVTPEQGVDGFSSIDVTVNVPSDVNNQNKTVSPSTSSQTVEADSGYSGLGTVTVNAVTSSIDNNILSTNIKKDVTILGVTGSYDPQPDLQSKTVNPSTSQQTVTPDQGKDGLSSVTVTAVTAAIDSNIQAENILSGVTILGVEGTDEGYDTGYTEGEAAGYQTGYDAGYTQGQSECPSPELAMVSVVPTTSLQTIEPPQGYDGFNIVNVLGVTNAIDPNIASENIKNGVSILGITGNYTGSAVNNQNKTVSPSTSQQSISADQGYTGLGTVTVNAVTSAIDQNIQPANILSGITILGVEGTDLGYDAGEAAGEITGYQSGYSDGYSAGQAECPTPVFEQLNVTPTTSAQQIFPVSGDGFDEVNVSAVTAAIDQNIAAGNIKSGVSILGVTGNYDPQPNLDSINVTPTTSAQQLTPSSPVDGYNEINVAAVTAAIDANIQAGNIKSGVTILGVQGTVVEGITPTGNINITDTNSTDVTNYATAQVVDANLVAGNIKNGVTILGVSGSYQPVCPTPNLDTLNVTPTTSAQTITPTSPVDGYDEVVVSAVTSAIDQNIVAGNIKNGVTILGVQGSYSGGSCTVFDPVGYDCSDLNALFGNGVTTSASVQPDAYGFTNTNIMFAPKASYVQNNNMLFHYEQCKNLLAFAGCSIRYNSITPGTVIPQGLASMFNLDDALLSAVGEIEFLDSDGEKITDPLWANNLFYGCSKLVNVDLTINPIANASYMFYCCYNINNNIMDWVEDQDFTHCSNYMSMFDITGSIGIPTATIAPDIDMSAATNVSRMFFYNNYSGASDMGWLVTVPQYNWGSVTNVESAFDGQYKITTLGGFINLGKAFSSNNPNGHILDLSGATGLTKQSIMNVINNLAAPDDTNVNDATLKLSATSYALLDASDIAVATAKNWSVISA